MSYDIVYTTGLVTTSHFIYINEFIFKLMLNCLLLLDGIKVIGSEDATTCHIVVIRHSGKCNLLPFSNRCRVN